MRNFTLLILAGLISFTARGESLDELLGAVEKNNLELKAKREQLKASGYDLKGENTLDATSIEYSPFFRRGAAGVASSELIVSQEFDFPTVYSARSKYGRMQMGTLEREYDVARRDILQQTALNYLNLVRLDRLRDNLVKRLDTSKKIAGLYAKKMDAGDATSIEINRIKIQIMELETALLTNVAEREETLAAIMALNGYESMPFESKDYPVWHLTSGTTPEMAGRDVEIKAADSQVETSLQEERVARQGWLPKLTLGYRRNTELDEASNGFIVGAAFPLFSTSSKVKAAKARKAAAEVEADNARRKVENEISLAIKEIQIIDKTMKAYDLTVIKEGRELLEKSLDAGLITLTDYYSEEALLNEKTDSYIDLEYEYYRRLCVLYKNTLR